MCRPAVFRRPDECLLCRLTSAMLQARVGTASAMLFTSDRKMSFAKCPSGRKLSPVNLL
jgi:hypothetical protein